MPNLTTTALTAPSFLPPLVTADLRFALLEQLWASRIASLDITSILVDLVDVVDASALPSLALQFSLFGDGWELTTDEQAQRTLIKNAIEIHQHKGTPWAVKRFLALLGFGDSQLVERIGYYNHDRSIAHNGLNTYPAQGSWAHYKVLLGRPIKRIQAANVRNVLRNIAPARCVLVGIDYTSAALKHDAAISHNADYSFGIA